MNEYLQNIEYVFPRQPDLDNFMQLHPEEPFSPGAIDFLHELSILLRNDIRANDYPEIITFSFFCRKANLIDLKRNYEFHKDQKRGRGIVFHIPPSNMPLNFAYSFVSGILSGNLNIVRMPSRRFVQSDIIIGAIQLLSEREKFRMVAQRLLFVRYGRENPATHYFSSVCDARIIWGSDKTIEEIKRSSLSPKAIDIGFGDKYSICIINADHYIKEEHPGRIARSFYNDTFLFDQNACTSPHLVVWLGHEENILKAKEVFWNNLHEVVKTKYDLQPRAAIEKLTMFYKHALGTGGLTKIRAADNLIWRIELEELSEDIMDYRCNSGYFLEYNISILSELSPVITEQPQTIASYGIPNTEWEQLGMQMKLNLANRIKPIGKTSEFSLIWDDVDLIDTLSAISKEGQQSVTGLLSSGG